MKIILLNLIVGLYDSNKVDMGKFKSVLSGPEMFGLVSVLL